MEVIKIHVEEVWALRVPLFLTLLVHLFNKIYWKSLSRIFARIFNDNEDIVTVFSTYFLWFLWNILIVWEVHSNLVSETVHTISYIPMSLAQFAWIWMVTILSTDWTTILFFPKENKSAANSSMLQMNKNSGSAWLETLCIFN